MILFLQILGALAAVALGFYLGYSPYTQSQEEIEARMGSGKPRRAKRHFMWLNYFRTDERASTRGRKRQRFQTVVARDKTVVPRRKNDRLPRPFNPEGGAGSTAGSTGPKSPGQSR